MCQLTNDPHTDELLELSAAVVRSATGDPLIPRDDILAARLRKDGSLAVAVWPGPKLVFTPEQVQDAARLKRSWSEAEMPRSLRRGNPAQFAGRKAAACTPVPELLPLPMSPRPADEGV